MKIILDIPDKIVNLASSLLIAKINDDECEDAIGNAVEALHDETTSLSLEGTEGDAYNVQLALAMLAIIERVEDTRLKEKMT